MNYTAQTKPGMQDPDWYEWTVGQTYLVEMLNPDSHILYVEYQADVFLGLDDIVVTYNDGRVRYIQVKHTRSGDSLTFGDLVSVNTSKPHSLLYQLAEGWNKERKKSKISEVILFTNRYAGEKTARAGNNSILRPPLSSFLPDLETQLTQAKTFSDLVFPEYENAWSEWCEQLTCIEEEGDKLLFLRNLRIKPNQKELSELDQDIRVKLQEYLGVGEDTARLLHIKMTGALKEWTVSTRASSRITVEKLYDALSIIEDSLPYNHDLIPVPAFFESRQKLVDKIEYDLLNSCEKYYFLSGDPGSGKTNIISKLCCGNASVIDIRYYAFEPIDPAKEYFTSDVSTRVSKDVFWNTLLNKLRELLQGKLYKYKVPVSNSFLTLEEKRKHFFRIIEAYAKEENRYFIIAVDGIDHAARAGVIENTFLHSLPHPDYLPNNVKILISGQPKDKYNYPIWLYQSLPSVKEYCVPSIQPSDVVSLVNDKCSHLDEQVRLVFSNIIYKYAEGNTLAAVFACHEALTCKEPVEFEKKLQSRKLSGNIQDYYLSIWNNAKKQMGIPFVDYKMAGTFAFLNEHIDGKKLNEIYSQEPISVSMWNCVLKALSPLLNEHNGSYSVLHNDVRVFFAGIIGVDQSQVKEVYSNLSNYYINQKERTHGYYSDSIRFLIAAGRIQEFDSIYSPEFVLSAYVDGIEIAELKKISNDLLEHVISETPLDWNKLRILSLGYLTIDQIEKSSYEIDDTSFRRADKHLSTHPYECFVTSKDKWNSHVLADVLNLIDELYESGEQERGRSVFCNWFANTDVCEINNILKEDTDDLFSGTKRDFSKLLARVIVHVGKYTWLSSIDRELAKNEQFLSGIARDTEDTIFHSLCGDEFSSAFSSLHVHFIDSLILGIKRKIENNQFCDIITIARVLGREPLDNSLSKLVLTFLNILSDTSISDDITNSQLCEEIRTLEIPETPYEIVIPLYSIYAVVRSYIQTDSRASIANDIVAMYMKSHKYESSNYMLLFFNSVCYLGKWLRARRDKKPFLESADDLGAILKNLYCKKWSYNERGSNTFDIEAMILKAFINLSKDEDTQFQSVVNDWYERIFADNPANQLLDPGMLYYRNDIDHIQKWIDEWLCENGRVWNEEIGCRNRIIKKFYDTTIQYGLFDKIDFRGALERACWSIIGFASHKEYSVQHLLNCYRNLVQNNIQNVYEFAIKVKEVSDRVNQIGDNRISYELNTQFYSDFGSLGDGAIIDLLRNDKYLTQGMEEPAHLADILIGYLKTQVLDKERILIIWSLGIGLLDWRDESDHATIAALRKAVALSAVRNEISDIENDLRIISPAYIDLHADPVKFIIPERWWDEKHELMDMEESRRIVSNYLSKHQSNVGKHEVSKALATLFQSSSLSNEQIEVILRHEFDEASSSIRNNSICAFLVGIGDDRIVDYAVSEYISKALERENFYPELDLPEIISWRSQHKDNEFLHKSMESQIKMFDCWITAANHITMPFSACSYAYSNDIELDSSSVPELYIQLLLLVVMSEDADAARTALGGIASVLRLDVRFVKIVEAYWDKLHYRAKEWIIMVYEYVYWVNTSSRKDILEHIKSHSRDDDFNVALYAKLLSETIDYSFAQDFQIEKKSFFGQIPRIGVRRLIKRETATPWITGYDYVIKQIERLSNNLSMDLSDIERRTADYSDNVETINLIPLNRRKQTWCKTVCDKTNLAFYRVLYSDWYNGRWNNHEVEIARSVLSATEPYCMLLSPARWLWNNGVLFDHIQELILQPEIVRNASVEQLLKTGIDVDEMVLAGAVEDYTHKRFLYGCIVSCFDIPGLDRKSVAYNTEQNARLFLQSRDDYLNPTTCNVTLIQNGVESFKQSIMMCGFAKYILSAFGWSVAIQNDGIKLVRKDGRVVGRFEQYYGVRVDIGNRDPANQPYLQRWIVNKNEVDISLKESHCPYHIVTVSQSITRQVF